MSRIAYISGRPGAGKSSLAFPLAADLGYSLVTKDMVKEALHDALYVPGSGEFDLAWSRRLGAASFALLWTLAARAGDMVIEANFDPHNDEALGQLGGLVGRTVEVHCACPAEVAVARYNARPRHEVHWLKTATLTTMDRYDQSTSRPSPPKSAACTPAEQTDLPGGGQALLARALALVDDEQSLDDEDASSPGA